MSSCSRIEKPGSKAVSCCWIIHLPVPKCHTLWPGVCGI